ncbi:MAG: pyridoxamine 5'-phosphate oxidase family protein [Candidatus Omnitrophica bacterium]|nr:pyridoxamine 5'-phosphate oxidase family protein [Candidatus Omnitrophota bacterium]
MRISDDIIHFLNKQNYTVVSTIGRDGYAHNSCKGIVTIDPRGYIQLLDLYKQSTYKNLKRNPVISLTAVDEHKFIGYSLKGRARIVDKEDIQQDMLLAWNRKITSRLSGRLIRNIKGDRGHSSHPEAILPEPEYIIYMRVEKIVDLTPRDILKQGIKRKEN